MYSVPIIGHIGSTKFTQCRPKAGHLARNRIETVDEEAQVGLGNLKAVLLIDRGNARNGSSTFPTFTAHVHAVIAIAEHLALCSEAPETVQMYFIVNI